MIRKSLSISNFKEDIRKYDVVKEERFPDKTKRIRTNPELVAWLNM